MRDESWHKDLLTPSWANLQLAFVVIMLMVANLSIAISQIALGCSLAVMLWRTLRVREPLPCTGMGRWTIALAIWALGMIPLSTDPGQSLVFYKRFFLFTAMWITASVAYTRPRQWLLLAAVVAGAVVASLWGQVYLWQASGSLFKIRLDQMSNSMTSGCLLMMSLLLMGGFIISHRVRTRVWSGMLLAAAPVALALIQTMTRSAWLGLVAGVGLMLLLARPRLFGAFLGVILVGLLILPNLPDSMVSETMKRRLDPEYFTSGGSTSKRVDMWHEGWAMVKEHPLTGVGDRDLEKIGPQYYSAPGMIYFGHLHSNPVMLAAIWGVPGLILGMGFLFRQLWLLGQRWRQFRKTMVMAETGWTLGALGIWAGFFVAGLTEWYFGDAESMLLYLAIMGIALGLPLKKPQIGDDHV